MNTVNELVLLGRIDTKLSISLSKIIIGLETTFSTKWCDSTFINEQNVIILFKILREAFKINEQRRLKKQRTNKMLGAALYFAYSYLGAETGYPFTSFIIIDNDDDLYFGSKSSMPQRKSAETTFWQCVIELTNALSTDMLTCHKSYSVFQQLRNDLRCD